MFRARRAYLAVQSSLREFCYLLWIELQIFIISIHNIPKKLTLNKSQLFLVYAKFSKAFVKRI